MISQNNAQETAFYLGTTFNLLSRRVCLTGYTIIIQLVWGKLSSVDGVVVSTVSREGKQTGKKIKAVHKQYVTVKQVV